MIRSIFERLGMLILAISLPVLSFARAPAPSDQKLFPITHATKNDGLPKTIRVKGTISKIEYAPPACGELIFAATIEVKLDRKLNGYKHANVYLVVPCLYQPKGEEHFLNRRIEITATKRTAEYRPCFFDIGKTSIDSKGLPFFCAKREDLLKAIVPEPPASAGLQPHGSRAWVRTRCFSFSPGFNPVSGALLDKGTVSTVFGFATNGKPLKRLTRVIMSKSPG